MTEPELDVTLGFTWRLVTHRLGLATLAATGVLILLGGLVTNTGAALAVPDWPSTFGYNMILFPWSRMVGGIFYEHSHRLMGALVGLLTFALAAVLGREGGRLRRLGLLAVGAVLAQGLLGGLRVVLLQDTYFIVAHIHYVVFGGSIFGAFAAIYYWFPKMFGRMTNPLLGHLHFWPTFIFFNLTFFPMHIIGVGGQMRRIYNPMQYEFLQHQQHWNVFITVSAFCLGLGQIPFVVNFFWSLFAGKKAPLNPWNSNTLEWTAPSPPPHLNWGPTLPTVYRGPYEYSSPESRDDWLPQTAPPVTAAGARRH